MTQNLVMESAENCIREICKVDKILYAAANNYRNDPLEKNLSVAIEIIGKVYSASPERRSYKNDSKKGYKVTGDGMGTFYDEIAERLNQNLKSILNDIVELKLEFNNERSDYEKLEKSINLVFKLNKYLKIAIANYDERTMSDEPTNHISFCSKFLNFLNPDAFFIIDSYSFNGGKKYIKTRNWKIVDDELCVTEKFNGLIKYAKNIKCDNSDYSCHVMRSYIVACLIKNKYCEKQFEDNKMSLPKVTDAMFMKEGANK